MKGDLLGTSPGLDSIMVTRPHLQTGDLISYTFSSALQKVEARGAKVLVPPDGDGDFLAPKSYKEPRGMGGVA